MKIQVDFNADHVTAYRLLGYENRAIADDDFRDDRVDAGEVGAGHRVTALYELVLDGDPLPDAAGDPVGSLGETGGVSEVAASDLVLVKVRYKRPGATSTDAAREVSASIAPAAVATDPSGADDDLRFAYAVAAFAEILKQSAFADESMLDALGGVFEAQRERDRDREAFADQFRRARTLLR
jgi:Ca-activated chloride channel family protein